MKKRISMDIPEALWKRVAKEAAKNRRSVRSFAKVIFENGFQYHLTEKKEPCK